MLLLLLLLLLLVFLQHHADNQILAMEVVALLGFDLRSKQQTKKKQDGQHDGQPSK